MKTSKELSQKAVREIEVSRKISKTPVGQTDKSNDQTFIDTINQVFALFRLNYHNQYFAAFQDHDQLRQIKRLWRDTLADYPIELILLGAKHSIERSEYLPTLNQMLSSCQDCIDHLGLPKARDAFIEACQAASPKAEQNWSHPSVYLAGRDSGWLFLANHREEETWPVFKEKFFFYVQKFFSGEKLALPSPSKKESSETKVLTKQQNKEEMNKLRKNLGI